MEIAQAKREAADFSSKVDLSRKIKINAEKYRSQTDFNMPSKLPVQKHTEEYYNEKRKQKGVKDRREDGVELLKSLFSWKSNNNEPKRDKNLFQIVESCRRTKTKLRRRRTTINERCGRHCADDMRAELESHPLFSLDSVGAAFFFVYLAVLLDAVVVVDVVFFGSFCNADVHVHRLGIFINGRLTNAFRKTNEKIVRFVKTPILANVYM